MIGVKTRYEISTMADKVTPSLIDTNNLHLQKFSINTYAVDIISARVAQNHNGGRQNLFHCCWLV